jgi:hypothetical protein
MTTEREAVGAAIDATVKREQIRFDPEQRNMLLQHYAGLAMQASLGSSQQCGVFIASDAGRCVNIANEMIAALERFANFEASKVQGNG